MGKSYNTEYSQDNKIFDPSTADKSDLRLMGRVLKLYLDEFDLMMIMREDSCSKADYEKMAWGSKKAKKLAKKFMEAKRSQFKDADDIKHQFLIW